MAVVNTLSTNAAPLTHPQTAAAVTGQRTERIRRNIAITSGDSIGSTYLIGQIPDTAIVDSIDIEGNTITGITSADVGLYDMNGVVKTGAGNFYASALNLTSSAGLGTGDLGLPTRKATANRAQSTINDQVWMNAGDVEGPLGVPIAGSTLKGSKYQIGLLLNAAATATGTLTVSVNYRRTP